MKTWKRLALITGILATTAVLTACGTADADEVAVDVVRIGVVGSFHEQWEVVQEKVAEDGIEIELVHFTEGTLINQALADGDIDLNAFQNIGFFVDDIEARGLDLTHIGYTFVSPMNVFAGGGIDLEPDGDRPTLAGLLPDGASIGIPNNVTNAGRALKLLEAAGLLELEPDAGFLASVNDITYNPFNIEIVEAEAGALVSLLPDLEAAIINGAQALTGGLSPTRDSIFREDSFNLEVSHNLVNIIVARTEEADSPVFARIVKAYQTPEVAEVFATVFQGSSIPAWE